MGRKIMKYIVGISLLMAVCLVSAIPVSAAEDIVHDGEYYFLKAQYGDKWAK
jgi:hypothetical protein